ncbi:MAG: CinA family protein [Thermodesulfovibrionia bacterium]|nr:CinA family protein [Thermodesulfovibrionia bacterium]
MKQELLKAIKKVHKIFKERGLTLSAAESCTGGLISHYITTLSGASAFFVAGIVSYSGDAKKTLLGVSSKTIQHYGVVSEETAREMAEKVRLLTKTDYSISTTGNLGPDVLEGKEQGLIYIVASREGKTISRRLKLTGDREANKEEAALTALRLLIELVESR